MKFGGTSVANIERIRNVARHVKREVEAGHEVAVVVSAMSGKTNELVGWCQEASPLHDAREYDAVVASGEQVTVGPAGDRAAGDGHPGALLAGLADPDHDLATRMARRASPTSTAPSIVKRFRSAARSRSIAGFQGIHEETGRITTLGRGGSDTSAVAIAAAIEADRCDIYTDVDGVYTTDPRVVPKARRLDKVAFEEMLEMASLGAKVLQVRSVELAMVHQVRDLRALELRRARRHRSARHAAGHPDLRRGGNRGTTDRHRHRLLQGRGADFRSATSQDKPGVAAAIFGPLADANINVDMIVQIVSDDGATTDITFTVPAADYERARTRIAKAKDAIGYDRLEGATDVVKVSVIGIGMRSHAGVAAQAFKALAAEEHQHPRDHHVGDQVLGADRRRLYRACGAHAALALRPRQPERRIDTRTRTSLTGVRAPNLASVLLGKTGPNPLGMVLRRAGNAPNTLKIYLSFQQLSAADRYRLCGIGGQSGRQGQGPTHAERFGRSARPAAPPPRSHGGAGQRAGSARQDRRADRRQHGGRGLLRLRAARTTARSNSTPPKA